ncbi:hypothetical protein [Roseateles sp.]|uniref:hypothetical protein n=1 Tax=Roseateles sp. TaxID=1971397 RepID=UPI002F4098EF
MASLATVADLEARIGRTLTTTEAARAEALLADASGLIRGYTRQHFEQVEDDVVQLTAAGSFIRLPQRPVTAVSSVVAISYAPVPDLTLPEGTWGWDGIDLIEVYPAASDVWVSLPESLYDAAGPGTFRITYDHGYADIPADVVAVCCRMVLSVLLAPTMAEGLVQERVGQYAYQYGQAAGQASPGATVRLSDADRDDLARYKRTSGTIAVRVR